MNGSSSIWTDAPLSWFRVSGPVGQKPYFTLGIILAAAKYAIEFAVVLAVTGQLFTPVDYLNPWLNSKAPFVNDAPWLGLAWLAFTIPFVWIAVVQSVRRAADIGISPWCGLIIFAPLVNILAMLLFAAIPKGAFSKESLAEESEQQIALAEAYKAPTTTADVSQDAGPVKPPPFYVKLLPAIVAGCSTQLIVGVISVWLLQTYGFVLFFSSPAFAGAAAAFVYSGGFPRTGTQLLGMTFVMNCVSFVGMLVIGIDGAVCLIMALPILAPLSMVGAMIGAGIGTGVAHASLRPGRNERGGMMGMMILLPICLALESLDNHKPIHSVTTSIVVQAPPEVVWNQVIAFPEIVDEMPWLFRLGIAAPMRARIEGHGVGAIRYCEFTTGDFVEPITVWEPPHHLAFDVESQPHPMSEWTPIPGLHPPHLEDGMKSLRGEFRLEALPNGRTKLSGTTWYQLNVRPRLYWKCWADPVLHTIHRRVLNHIGEVATVSELDESQD